MSQVENPTPMSASERRKLLDESVHPRNDASAVPLRETLFALQCSDEVWFAGNDRTARLRPPLPDEQSRKARSIAALGLAPLVMVCRPDMETPHRAVALLAVPQELFASLTRELARMSDEATIAVLDKPGVNWWPLDS